LPEYAALQTAKAAYEERQASLDEAQRLLRAILKRDSALPDLALFRKATTVHAWLREPL